MSRYGYLPTVAHTIGENSRTVPVSDSNPLPITASSTSPVTTSAKNTVSQLNNITVPLGIGDVFTGTGEDVLEYVNINVTARTSMQILEG